MHAQIRYVKSNWKKLLSQEIIDRNDELYLSFYFNSSEYLLFLMPHLFAFTLLHGIFFSFFIISFFTRHNSIQQCVLFLFSIHLFILISLCKWNVSHFNTCVVILPFLFPFDYIYFEYVSSSPCCFSFNLLTFVSFLFNRNRMVWKPLLTFLHIDVYSFFFLVCPNGIWWGKSYRHIEKVAILWKQYCDNRHCSKLSM